MTNVCKYLLETFFMFAVPVVALSMLDDIFIEDAKVFPEYICYAMFFLARWPTASQRPQARRKRPTHTGRP